MGDDITDRLVADRRRALGVILTHRPVRSWRSLGRVHCGACGLRWETDGELVGCMDVMRATVLLADPHPSPATRAPGVWVW